MAEGGEPPIQKVRQKVFIGSSDQKKIGHRLSAELRYARRGEQIEDAGASSSPEEQPNTAEGGEPPIKKDCQKVFIASREQERIGHRLSYKFRYDTRVQQIKAAKAYNSEEKAEELICKSDYKGALSILEVPYVIEYDVFDLKLMLTECYLYLGKHGKGLNMIDQINKSIMGRMEGKPDEVMKYAENYLQDSKYIRAIIVIRKVSNMYLNGTYFHDHTTYASTPEGSFNGIKLCSEKAYFATKRMIEASGISRSLGVKYGIEYMKDILRDFGFLKNVEPEDRALTVAWSCYFIGSSLQSVQQYKQSKEYLKRGIKILVKQFGPDELVYRVYGSLLFHLGTAYDHLGKFETKGGKFYTEGIQAKNKATDYPNEKEKLEDIELSENIFKTARERGFT